MPKDRKTPEFREYNRKYQNEWYHNNKESAIESRKKYKRGVKDKITEYKANIGCISCGESDPVCLDFHHIDPKTKEYTIATAGVKGLSFEKVLLEIKKCEVLCANCHRKRHSAV